MADNGQTVARRSILSRFGVGAALVGVAAASGCAAQEQTAASAGWQPARHPDDDWLEQLPGVHRFVLDTTTPAAAGGALLYANNFFIANKNGYGLDATDLAVVIVLRHFSTPFAYNDAIWVKYGPVMSDMLMFNDPNNGESLTFNIYNSGDYGMALPNFGATLDAVIGQGVHFAVCDMATHFLAGELATRTNGDADAIYAELAGALIANSHMVPAGIVAVNRAQERGYSFAYVA